MNCVTDDWPESVRRAVNDHDVADAVDLIGCEELLTDAEKALMERIERTAIWCCASRLVREGRDHDNE